MQNQEELKRVRENEVVYWKIKQFINNIQSPEMACNSRVNTKGLVMIASDYYLFCLLNREEIELILASKQVSESSIFFKSTHSCLRPDIFLKGVKRIRCSFAPLCQEYILWASLKIWFEVGGKKMCVISFLWVMLCLWKY